MKIAVFGDIHGNIEALMTSYQEALSVKTEKMYHLGDLGGYSPFVNEVVEFLREHNIDGVQGNYDESVANDAEHCGCKAEDAVQEEMANRSFAWTKAHATPETKNYMRNLPSRISFSAHGRDVLLFHAAPHKNNLYWHEDRPEKFFREMAAKAEADVLVYGHTHRPYRKNFENKVFINAGSVGRPKDGDPRTCVAIIDIFPSVVEVEFKRIPYDVEKAAAAIIANGLPKYFAERIRVGK